MTKEELIKLIEEKTLQDGLEKCASTEEAQKFLKENGIDITVEDLEKIREELTALSDGDLENLAGGSGAEGLLKPVKTDVNDYVRDDTRAEIYAQVQKGQPTPTKIIPRGW